jgi:hypothetical protein
MAVRVSCSLPPGPDAPDHVALAEALGYERAWFYDSPALYGDVWIAMARALELPEGWRWRSVRASRGGVCSVRRRSRWPA